MKSRFITLFAALGMLAMNTSAQSAVDDFADSLSRHHKLIYVDGRPAPAATQAYVDSVRAVISNFYYDQFRHFQDPEAPYFMFLSKDASLAMGIGGAVRMRAYYDWGGAIPASGFAPYLIPMEPNPTSMRHFGTTPAGTCLFFRVIGRNKTLGNYQLYIEANFNGYNSRDFLLKKAYAVINNFTVGYAPSTFSDPAAIAPTVDAQGPANKIAPTAVLVRYMPQWGNWSAGVSAETPSPAIDTDDVHTAKLDDWMPDFAALVQYQWARGQHLRLSGIVRTLGYRDIASARNHHMAGWGLQLSCVAHPLHPLTTYANINYGAGYESLGGDLLIGKYDLVADPDNAGRMYAPRALGWSIGIQYNFRPNLFATIVASQTRYLPSKQIPADMYKTGIFTAANVFWYMTPRMAIAAEIDFGVRRDFSRRQRHAQRVGAMCQFSF